MVKIDNGWRVFTVEEDGIGALRNSRILKQVLFDIHVSFVNERGERCDDYILVFPQSSNTYTLNGREYTIKTSDDVIAFRADLEAAYLEDILDDENNTGK